MTPLSARGVFRTALVLTIACAGAALPLHADEAGADAAALFAAGRFDEARDAAKATLAKDATNADAARLLQDALLVMGDAKGAAAVAPAGAPEVVLKGLAARVDEPKKAAKALTAIVKTDGAPPRFRLDLARAHLAAGTASAAEAAVTVFLKATPDDAEAMTLLADVLVVRNKKTTARKTYTAVLEATPGHAGAAIGLATVLAGMKRGDESREILKAALAVHPRHPHLLIAMADDQVRTGEYDAALRTLGTVLDLPVPKADVHAHLAEVHRAKADYKSAETCAKAATAIEQNHARAIRVMGFVKFKRGDLEGALGDYGAVALLRPDYAQIHADIALVQLTGDKLKEAEAAAKQALKIDKNLLDGHLRMGQVLYLRGKGKQAKKSFDAVLKQQKDHVLVNRYMGYVLLDEGKPKSAIKHFQVVADALEKDSSSVRMVGRCQLEMGKVEDAVNSFREAVSRNEKDGWAFFDLGKGLEKQEKWDDAAAAYEQAIAVDPKLPHPRLYLAELLDEVQGEPEQALPHYKAYLELGGHDEGKAIAKRIEQLEKP